MRDLIIVGNWKCNKTVAEAKEFCTQIKKKVKELPKGRIVAICPPVICLPTCYEMLKDTEINLGVQNFFSTSGGAYTGETSLKMVEDFGVKYAIIGHSERRLYFFESDEFISTKVLQASLRGITPIVCIGERIPDCTPDEVADILYRQISDVCYTLEKEDIEKIIWAYEPVWAIGSKKSATAKQAEFAGDYIKRVMKELYNLSFENTKVLYGGSVNVDNAKDFCNCNYIDGLLIGGASLDSEKFSKFCTEHYIRLNALVDSNIQYKKSTKKVKEDR